MTTPRRTQMALQQSAVDIVIRRLRARDHRVTRRPYGELSVDGLHLEVRAARERRQWRWVRVAGRDYCYRQRLASWCRHRHGQRLRADLWVLVDLTSRQIAVVPDDVGGLVITHHIGRYRGHEIFARYRERWDLVGKPESAGRRAA
jgi:hypothetical protein